jgi:uncharacterized membrane protein
VFKRFRRYVLFIALGYFMHLPVKSIHGLADLTAAGWQALFQVDVLQCIGLALIGLQALVLLSRTPRQFAIATAAAGGLIVLAAPLVWTVDWAAHLPLATASYLSAGTGSLFPLFPWSAYVLAGAAVGYLLMRESQGAGKIRLAPWALAGVLAPSLGVAFSKLPINLYDYPQSWAPSPNIFLVRAGAVLLLLTLVTVVTRRVQLPARPIQNIASESLPVYFVHICILYGSVWNVGVREVVGAQLTPAQCVGPVALLVACMILGALGWRKFKSNALKFRTLIRGTPSLTI